MKAVVDYLLDELGEDPRVDRIYGRVKETGKFMAKAEKKNQDGSPKYGAPLEEIIDQVGARIIVKFEDDRGLIDRRCRQLFNPVKSEAKRPDRPEMFDYEATHLDLLMPPDIQSPTAFFELQVCTLFQHAWAEANHDLGYKGHRELDDDQARLAALAAANAWGADHSFNELRRELIKGAKP